ncbi:protein transport protein SEC16A homolog isoform X1 [Zingiber officinale]|uniref:protein transport protein SEC16A homolog isoform X1 n=1 Tax=Zingiber officinale TaxID=94328 RepID=UPI001C4C1C8B|nr:protein transport protein SEC16A homolog isoform X1 [Zingiber officinale]XP_042384724.1 protein transport protein SEC16A homolog isoform X1 [Zingiber officinale]XP_042384725.1 protein transport protein SEC16A homolog isoform X1 [Zingiber officinale]XP_042384727.1 protein transport protein SEC16A homolog isoform X1 [Zingiber officinale]XP_042384728.1 protein transport protein SEC16A homolog isoform X1 [Zingiber officinale]XP_042384729.1 protein transport protein SEC16A homolog isoform X1 [Zi
MASSSPSHVVDQTDDDHDFFNNLVDGDFGGNGSHIRSKEIARDLSNLSLDDTGTFVDDPDDAGLISESNGPQKSETLQLAGYPEDYLASHDSPTVNYSPDKVATSESSSASILETAMQSTSPTNNAGSRGTCIKQVQWSAFSLGTQQSDNVGLETSSDFFVENVNPSDKLNSNADFNFLHVENQVKNVDTHTNSQNNQESQLFSSVIDQNTGGVDAQYWERLYPGWKYDSITGQWYQLDGYNENVITQDNYTSGVVSQGNFNDNAEAAANLGSSEDLYLQQISQSALETIAEESTSANTATTYNWNIVYQENMEFPPNMVFDPQYPGWYYDTNTQQWYTLESYTQTTKIPNVVQNEAIASAGFSEGSYSVYDEVGRPDQRTDISLGSQEFWHGADLSSSYSHQQNMLQAKQISENRFSHNQQMQSFYKPSTATITRADNDTALQTFKPMVNHGFGLTNGAIMQYNSANEESTHPVYLQNLPHSMQQSISNSFLGNHNSVDFRQPSFQDTKDSYSMFSHAPDEGRSSAGRPAHALVSFGFGGKLVVTKNSNSSRTNLDYGIQEYPAGAISILNLSEVVKNELDASNFVSGTVLDYFHSLYKQKFPGPLVGGSASTKDINKWLDERILSYDGPVMEFHKGKFLKLLLSLLRISLQHYGKLRSPFGSDLSLEDLNGPEEAVCKLFASSKISSPFGGYGSYAHCLNNIPPESQLQATAARVQSLLVSGKRKEALQSAQVGQLWGLALVLAAQLGDKFYVDTVKKMAQHQFAFGSPLRSLCLLIAGQPADVFSADNAVNFLSMALPIQSAEVKSSGMLDEWQENLAIVTANRTKDDELVIIHLGDCLWKDKGEVTAAHTCYLVAEANIEPYSDSARLCLIGADHLKYPRTYASADAIQRTELYEYSKVQGNSQFILLPFQPYKIIYAHMLAEVGKIPDSLKYCQSASKLLKSSARTSELEIWKSVLSSLEDRLRIHQQGGYGSSLAPGNLVGKLFTTFDRSIHRMIGAPAAPLPPLPPGNVNDKETSYSVAPKVSNSQSTMAMETSYSLVPSASVETMTEWSSNNTSKIRHNRSVSEPVFGQIPKQDSSSDGAQSKATSGGSRFGRIGSQLLQKTMGWVSRSHQQAKLGERNKFYYDEKLKRWVEEGADPPAEEAALPPPPTAKSFQNGMLDYKISNTFKSESIIDDTFKPVSVGDKEGPAAEPLAPSKQKSAIPPIPPSQNQFSAHGKVGIRSRYVDTFNKGSGGGGPFTKPFQSPALPSTKPLVSTKFFMPASPPSNEERPTDTASESNQDSTSTTGEDPPVTREASFSPPASSSIPSTGEDPPESATRAASFSPPASSSIPRFLSSSSIAHLGNTDSGAASSLAISRATSWSGNYELLNQTTTGRRPWQGPTMFSPTRSMPASPIGSSSTLQQNDASLSDDLQQIEL